MKLLFKSFWVFISVFWVSLCLAHSGGTDKYGCHAGSQPYHCHNKYSGGSGDESPYEIVEREFVFGFQKKNVLNGFGYYMGFSQGSEVSGDDVMGYEFGVLNSVGIYLGYSSSIRSFKLGYGYVYTSFKGSELGVGVKIPFSFEFLGSGSSVYMGYGIVMGVENKIDIIYF